MAISAGRRVGAQLLLLLAIPFVFFGLIDPLEGGISLLGAGLIYLVAFLLAGHAPTRLLWASYLAALAIGIVVLLFAMFGLERVDNEPPLFSLLVGVWVYRAAVALALYAAVLTAIRAFRQ